MAKISDIAKEKVMQELQKIFPESKVIDKKLYINFRIENENTQIAVSLTAPKSPVPLESDGGEGAVIDNFSQAERTQLEKEANEIMQFFNL